MFNILCVLGTLLILSGVPAQADSTSIDPYAPECESVFLNQLIFPAHARVIWNPWPKSLDTAKRRARVAEQEAATDLAQYLNSGKSMEDLVKNDRPLYNRVWPRADKPNFIATLQTFPSAYASYLAHLLPKLRPSINSVVAYVETHGTLDGVMENNRKVWKLLMQYGSNPIFVEELRQFPNASRAFGTWIVTIPEY